MFRRMILGAAAGAAGVWVMDRLDWWLWDKQPQDVRRRIEDARPGAMDPAHALANRLSERFRGRPLEPAQPHPAGLATHYLLGMFPAAVYGLLRRPFPQLTAGSGLFYGLGLFLAEDEGLGPALGLAGKPQDYPWQAHARGLLGHFAYGVITETVLAVAFGRKR